MRKIQEEIGERDHRFLGRLLVGITCGGILLVVLCYLYFALEPRFAFLSSECPFKRVFRLYCPGCGGTRAVSALLRGDVLTSVRSNPVVVWGLLLCIWQYARMVRSYIRRDRACFSIPSWSWISLIVIILGVFVVRNLLLVFVGYDYLGDNAAIWAYIWAR